MQEGFIKNNKLHGKWSSFNKTGINLELEIQIIGEKL